MIIEDYNIDIVVEHGDIHYKIIDMKDGSEIHCDVNELWKTIDELLEENETH